MTLSEQVIQKIIKHLLKGEDYRVEVVDLINEDFLQFAVEFFKKIVEAKLKNEDIASTSDWYKEAFLNRSLPPKEIAINAGLNTKTIKNKFNSEKKRNCD